MFVGASSPAAVFVGGTPVSAVYLGDQLVWAGGRWSGTIAAHSAASGGLTVERPLAGAVASASAATGGLTVDNPFRGTVAALSAATGALSVLKRLSGALAGQSALSGSLSVEKALGGTIVAVSGSSADLTVEDSSGFTFVGSNQAQAATVSIPAHQAGDIILICAYRSNNTPANLPAGWTNVQSGGANSLSMRVGRRVASGSGTTSGTWTNANALICEVYRPSGGTATIGASAMAANVSSPATWSGLTMEVTDGSSWVTSFIAASLTTMRTGHTERENVRPGGFSILRAGDTNGGVSEWASTTTSTGGNWRTVTVEIRLA